MIKPILFLTLVSLMISCSDNDGIIETGPDGFPLNYTYTVALKCYCTQNYVGPHRIKVEGGAIVDYDFLGDGDAPDAETQALVRLDKLHLQAEGIISEGPATESVMLDSESGFITDCYFDINLGIADEEWGYVVTDLKLQ